MNDSFKRYVDKSRYTTSILLYNFHVFDFTYLDLVAGGGWNGGSSYLDYQNN